MSNLNSILFEGSITTEPVRVNLKNSETVLVRFAITNFYEAAKMKTVTLPAIAWGSVGVKVLSSLKLGTNVRLCGRLSRNVSSNEVEIVVTDFLLKQEKKSKT